MDGTLLLSDAVIARVWGRWASVHGLDLEEILALGRGRRIADTVEQFCPPGLDPVEETARLEREEREDVDGIVAMPGILGLLDKLPTSRWAIVTSADRPLAEARLKAAAIKPPPVLICAEDVNHGKPDAEGYLQAARRLGVRPADTIVFEDSAAGLAAARASGAQVVAVAASADCAHPDHVASLADFSALSLRTEGDEFVLVL